MGAYEYCGTTAKISAFRRGDVDDNGSVQLTDAVRILNFLFAGGEKPTCMDAADVDDNGAVQLTDPVYFLNHLFAGGPEPTPPFAECGTDPNNDELTCESFKPCP